MKTPDRNKYLKLRILSAIISIRKQNRWATNPRISEIVGEDCRKHLRRLVREGKLYQRTIKSRSKGTVLNSYEKGGRK